MLGATLSFINVLFTLYSLAIILRALVSWFRVDYYHPLVRFLVRITDPLLTPLRRYVPPFGGLDITPMLALFIVWIAERLLHVIVIALL